MSAERKTFAEPDETRTFGHGRLDLVDVAGAQIGMLTLEPGWRWSEHVKPLAGTEWCEAPHFQFHVSGHPARAHERRHRVRRAPR